jgi:copper oxidase (laccase) domain-containing protein
MHPVEGGDSVDSIPNGGDSAFCPACGLIANQSRFDLSRGYIPVLLAAALFAGGLGAAFHAGGWLETFQQERSAVLARLDKIESKLDNLIVWVGPRQHAKK